MGLQRAKDISAAECLDAFIDASTPAVANIARGALARLRRQVPGAIELVGDRYTALVIGFSPTERPVDATLSIVLYPRWANLFFLQALLFVIRNSSSKGPAQWCGTSRCTIQRCWMIETCEPLSRRRAYRHASAFHDGGASSSSPYRPSVDRDAPRFQPRCKRHGGYRIVPSEPANRRCTRRPLGRY